MPRKPLDGGLGGCSLCWHVDPDEVMGWPVGVVHPPRDPGFVIRIFDSDDEVRIYDPDSET